MADPTMADFFGRADVQKYMDDLEGIDRLDLLALKAQVLIEHRLRDLLAIRMRADPEAVRQATKKTQAVPLIELVLCDKRLAWMRKELLMLNDARVAIAHGIDVTRHEPHLQNFIRAKQGNAAAVTVKRFRDAMWKTLYELELLESDLTDDRLESANSRIAKYAGRRSRR